MDNVNSVDKPKEEDALSFENAHVHAVYEDIAEEFSKSRFNVWPSVREFFDGIPSDESVRLSKLQSRSRVLEVGSGNGKNLMYLENDKFVKNKIGCDMSKKFVEMTKKKGIECVQANAIDLPFEDNSFDYVLSVAVIHHLSTPRRRRKAIEELIRVTKVGGHIFIHVWAFEQRKMENRDKPGRKVHFKKQDNMVSWNNKGDRFYHVFVEGELEQLVLSVEGAEILESSYDRGNWTVTLIKVIN